MCSCLSSDKKQAQLKFMEEKAALNERKVKPSPLQYLDADGVSNVCAH